MEEKEEEITLKDMLEEKAVYLLNRLDQETPGVKEYSAIVEDLCKISKIIAQFDEKDERIGNNWIIHEAEMKKINEELELKKRQLEMDAKLRDKELSDKRIGQFVSYGINAAGIIIPIMFYNTWMKKGFKFEETGTFTSTTFRGLFGKFKPTKVD